MPVRYRRRRYFRKPRAYKRKRRYARKYPVSRPLGQVHRFVRGCYLTVLTASAVAPVYAAYSFNLNLLPDNTEFTNLFDEYMISKVILTFLPCRIQQNNTGTTTVPWFIGVVDKDDDTTPTSFNTLLQYPKYKLSQVTRKHVFKFRPRFSVGIYNGIADAYGSRVGWIDCNNVAVPHYGFKCGIDQTTAANIFQYQIFCQMVILCRGVR